MSHVVLFAYPTKLNIATRNGLTKILQKKLLYIVVLCNICNKPRKYYGNSYFIAECRRCAILTCVIENKVCYCGTCSHAIFHWLSVITYCEINMVNDKTTPVFCTLFLQLSNIFFQTGRLLLLQDRFCSHFLIMTICRLSNHRYKIIWLRMQSGVAINGVRHLVVVMTCVFLMILTNIIPTHSLETPTNYHQVTSTLALKHTPFLPGISDSLHQKLKFSTPSRTATVAIARLIYYLKILLIYEFMLAYLLIIIHCIIVCSIYYILYCTFPYTSVI